MIIITGTSRGIGKALAEFYLGQGKRVLGIARNCSLSHPNYIHIKLDLNDEQAISSASFPELNQETEIIFIHNAGTIGTIRRVSDQEELDLQRVFQINLFSGAALAHQFMQMVPKHKQLSLVFISSGAGKRPIPSWAAYCASKAAVDLWLRTIYLEEIEKGRSISCYAIAPGVVDTEMQVSIRSTPENDFSSHERFMALQVNKELRTAEEVAEKIAGLIEQPSSDEIVVSC
jgi:benzil reductase ((S)-benzoin forming)